MFETTNNWEFFGYDLRLIGAQWRAAWREFLWGSNSPVLSRLDEPVRVHTQQGEKLYFAGKPIDDPRVSADKCSAILLPQEYVLSKQLSLPLAAETDLDAVMSHEVAAHNPFSEGDAACGWTVTGRTEATISVALAIGSLGGVMSYLAKNFDSHDPEAYEVWAGVEGNVVVLEGFGEKQRRGRYRQRLYKMAGLLGLCALLALAIPGVSAAFGYLELQRYEEMAALAQHEATDASRAREVMLNARDTITAANEYIANYPNPHVEIARLTQLLDDNASVISFSMAGNIVKVRGRARDAASVVQQLTAESDYLEVTSPHAISALGNTGFEEFYLDLTLVGRDAR